MAIVSREFHSRRPIDDPPHVAIMMLLFFFFCQKWALTRCGIASTVNTFHCREMMQRGEEKPTVDGLEYLLARAERLLRDLRLTLIAERKLYTAIEIFKLKIKSPIQKMN
jgi:hypothetical protein